jgi:hypothetical protein
MSSDYNRQIVVSWDGKIPMDEHGHHLDPDSVVPVESTHPWNYRKHRPYKRVLSARKVALSHVCRRELLGNRRKFFWGTELTNPYGCLQWAIGNGDDFTCFDYAMLPDGRVILHSTFNTETGSYIGDCNYDVVDALDAPAMALDMVGDGIDTAAMNETRHTKAGWNQDPYYFYRSVFVSCDPNLDAPNFSERERRMGGKRINKYCSLPVDIHKAIW